MSSKRTPAGISSILAKKASVAPNKANPVEPGKVGVAASSKTNMTSTSSKSASSKPAPSKAVFEGEASAKKKERDDLRAAQQAGIMEKRAALKAAQVSSVPEDFVSVLDVPGFMSIGAVNAEGVNIGGAYGIFFLPGQDQDGFVHLIIIV